MPTAGDRTAASERNTPWLRAVTRHGNWHDHAACGHADPDLFFDHHIDTDQNLLHELEEGFECSSSCVPR